MKLTSTTIIAALIAAPAFAGSLETPAIGGTVIAAPEAPTFGGYATVNYGYVRGNTEGNYGPDDNFSYFGFEGSVGSAGNGGFGWQIDANGEFAGWQDTGAYVAYYDAKGATAHANFGLGGATAGAFAGFGIGNSIDGGDASDMYWYGVEAAKSFGDFAVTAQVGFASGNNDHDSLDFKNYLFGGAQGRYFMGNNTMITANIGVGTARIHSATLLQTTYGIEGMMRLGQSNFYGTAAYRGAYMNGDYIGSEGQGGEQGIEIGITMLFGGGNLRDIFGSSTPMINNTMLTQMGVNTSTYD